MDEDLTYLMDFEQANFDDVVVSPLHWEGDEIFGPWAECLFDQCTRPNDTPTTDLLSRPAASEIPRQSLIRNNSDFRHTGQLSSPVAHTVQVSPVSMVQDGSAATETPILSSPIDEANCALDQRNPKRNIDDHLGRFPARGNENGRRKRKRYEGSRRQDVALMRKVNSCVRCRSLKVPVSFRSPP